MQSIDQATGMMIGLAVGDALGAPLEFLDAREPDNYITKYHTGGFHDVDKGEWTDDTAMTLAMCKAMLDKKAFDPNAIMDNFVSWYMEGEFIPRGKCFDIGTTTVRALERYIKDPTDPYKGTADQKSSGNGALMRTAAPVLMAMDRQELIQLATQQTLLTHAAPQCVQYGTMLAEELYYGGPLDKYKKYRHNVDIPREEVMSGGYVVETYTAAMWAFQTTDNFEDCVIAAVNRGHDSDTVGAVAGMIAGTYYGYCSIPAKFKKDLMWHDELYDTAYQVWAMRRR